MKQVLSAKYQLGATVVVLLLLLNFMVPSQAPTSTATKVTESAAMLNATAEVTAEPPKVGSQSVPSQPTVPSSTPQPLVTTTKGNVGVTSLPTQLPPPTASRKNVFLPAYTGKLMPLPERRSAITNKDLDRYRVGPTDVSKCPSFFPIDPHRQLYSQLADLVSSDPKALVNSNSVPYLLNNGSLLHALDDKTPFPVLDGTVCINAPSTGSTATDNKDIASTNDDGEYITHEAGAVNIKSNPASSTWKRRGIRIGSHASQIPSAQDTERGLLLVVAIMYNTYHTTQEMFLPVANLIRTRLLLQQHSGSAGTSSATVSEEPQLAFPLHVWVRLTDFDGHLLPPDVHHQGSKDIAALMSSEFKLATMKVIVNGASGSPPQQQRRCFECGLFVGEHYVERGRSVDGVNGKTTPPSSNTSTTNDTETDVSSARPNAYREAAVSMLRTRMAVSYNTTPYSTEKEQWRQAAPQEADAIWGKGTKAVGLQTAAAVEEGRKKTPWKPRLLLVGRRSSRRIGNIEELAEESVRLGFNVKVAYFENTTYAEQFRLVRYTDLLVSIHGAALTWVTALDTESDIIFPANNNGSSSVLPSLMRSGRGCRSLLELRHWGRPFKGLHNVYKGFALDANVHYRDLPGTRVVFDDGIQHNHAHWMLMKQAFPHKLEEFKKQTVFYNVTLYGIKLVELREHLEECLFP